LALGPPSLLEVVTDCDFPGRPFGTARVGHTGSRILTTGRVYSTALPVLVV
jgi:hypothetical protein